MNALAILHDAATRPRDAARDLAGQLDPAATDALLSYLSTLQASDLDEVIDASYDPPVTRGVHLVSVIDDAAQHIGQVAYVVGMPRRD